MSNWQQVLAVDAKFNSYRAPDSPGFKSLYLRRRSQLLKGSHRFQDGSNSNSNYLSSRMALLHQRYRVSLEQLSQRSATGTARSNSRLTMEGDISGPLSPMRPKSTTGHGSDSISIEHTQGTVVPTYKAEASRALVGGTTLGQNFEFSGMHHIFDQHKDSVTMVKFALNNASLLACSSLDGTLSICDISGEPRILHKLEKHTAGVTGFDWSMNNDFLLSCSLDGMVHLWSGQDGSLMRSVADQYNAQILSSIFHPFNPNWIVVGNSIGHVQILNVSTGRFPPGGTSQISGGVTSLAFDSGGKILWTGNTKGTIVSFIFCMESGRIRKGKRCVVFPDATITNIQSRTWASREARNPSLLVNCACNTLFLFKIVDEDGGIKVKSKFTIPHSSLPIQSCFSPIMSFRQGVCVVSGSEDGNVWLLVVDKELNNILNKLQGHSAPVISVAFSYDETYLASSDAGGVVIVWKRR